MRPYVSLSPSSFLSFVIWVTRRCTAALLTLKTRQFIDRLAAPQSPLPKPI